MKVRSRHIHHTRNIFCATGAGGGVDPSCGAGGVTVVDSSSRQYSAEFEVEGKKFDFLAGQTTPGTWDVSFAVGAESIDMRRLRATTSMEKLDDAIQKARYGVQKDLNVSPVKVLTHVGQALKQFIGEKNPRYITFSADLSEPSRVKAYDKLISRIEQATGYAALDARREFGTKVYTLRRADVENNLSLVANVLAGVDNAARKKRVPNPLRMDPTRTTRLRVQLVAELKRRFARLKGAIHAYFARDSIFNAFCPTGPGGGQDNSYNTLTVNEPLVQDPQRIRAFQKWLRTQVKGKLSTEQLWEAYAKAGVQKGAGRAFDDATKKRKGVWEGGREAMLKSSFTKPVAKERIQVLAGRAYDEMEGVTDAMETRMTRKLTDGLVQGKSMREIGDDIASEIDITVGRATTIARTEIIRAHAEGQLQMMEDMGVKEVGVAVEWATADDERVCEMCSSLEGVVLSIDEARGMLPRHPNCRCAWLPAGFGETDDQKTSYREVREAIKAASGDDDWGPATRISKDRPTDNAFCPTGPGGGQDNSCGGRGEYGSESNPIRVGSDIRYAAEMLAQGKHVRLSQPEQVSTLVDKMGSMIDKAIKSGNVPPKFDLCKVTAPGTSLFCQENVGIPRIKMPQMRGFPVAGTEADKLPRGGTGKVDVGRQFVEHLQATGTKVEQLDVKASYLRASQTELDGARVVQLVREARAGKDLRKRPIFVTQDNYIVDGHHHWAALVALSYGHGKDFKLPVYRLGTDIGTALTKANAFASKMGLKPKGVANAFCPTGEGGGVDPSCSPGERGTYSKIHDVMSDMVVRPGTPAYGSEPTAQEAKSFVAKSVGSRLKPLVTAKQCNDFLDQHADSTSLGFSTDPHERVAQVLVDEWANTANKSPLATAVQIRARSVFGLQSAYKSSTAEAVTEAHHTVFAEGHGPVIDAYLRATYEHTQEKLKDAGVEYIRVFRGYASADPVHGRVSSKLAPLSSWAYSNATAGEFSMPYDARPNPVVLSCKVHRSKIFSTWSTGPGCKSEQEVVVLGGIHKTFALPYDLHGKNTVYPRMLIKNEELELEPDAYDPDWPKRTQDVKVSVTNRFCATGKGGGVDPTCGAGAGTAPPVEHNAAKRLAKAKIRNAPVPSREAVLAAREELRRARAGEGRAGGENRGGSAAARRKQRENLFKEFGGEERGYVVCPWTGIKMHWTDDKELNPKGYPKFERGKIFTKKQGGGYQLANLIPESFAANRARNDKPIRKENLR